MTNNEDLVAALRSSARHYVVMNPQNWISSVQRALNGTDPDAPTLGDALLPMLLHVVAEDRQRLAAQVNRHRTHATDASAALADVVHLLHSTGDALHGNYLEK